MRRIDREMPAEFAYDVTDRCEYATLSMTDPEGLPYCLPVTIVRDEDTVYFHCARDGFKVQCLRANPQVCLACVCDTHIIAEKFTTEYASAILRGTASEVTDDAEKIHALRLLCQRHTPAGMDGFDAAVAKSLPRTAVWKIEISYITGKRKKYDSRGEEMKFGREE
ncbi:MAG: pyridoxamine 5'-phosphate oxidase family protein [Anaerovoracaceae bacterium]|nr:pyridoxamine 5'-phosphate oxidase family protein [Anaerovoracaceae bacterium]